MKKHLIIGNPISHTLSPKLHNYWFEKNKINGKYDKVLLKENEIESLIKKIKTKELHGMNVTVPYKQIVIPHLESLSETAKITNSVNTIFNKDGKIHGDNTDVFGFQKSLSKKI
jgi:shikimate dehydrogenase